MGLPFTSFILQIVVLALLITVETRCGVKAANNKLFSDICKKTKNPTNCFRILNINRTTNRMSSLRSLALPCLELARFHAERTAHILKMILKTKKDIRDKEKYEACGHNYMVAEKKINEAKTMLRKRDFASARKLMEVASKVPVSCKKEIGNPPNNAFSTVNENAEIHFEIALVTVTESENEKKMFKLVF
ncbi:hypothetical protein ACP275_08G080600 [Erythranthe tilingii]